MSQTAATATPGAQTGADLGALRPEHTEDFQRLERLWRLRTHYCQIYAAVNSDVYRDALITRLNHSQAGGIVTLPLGAHASDWLRQIEAFAQQHPQSRRLHVTLATGLLPDEAWWREANTLRERLADAFPWTQIFWAPDSVITRAARCAVDLWNWREAVCDFQLAGTGNTNPLPSPAFDPSSSIDVVSLRQRLVDIDVYLKEHDHTGASAHLLLESSYALERLGELDVAMQRAKQAAKIFLEQDNQSKYAEARGQVANILYSRGQLNEALDIQQNEVLPVYEKLGDVRAAAISRAPIANILLARGQLEEAVNIYKDEVLPALEEIGDVRATVITSVKIADILQVSGDMDKALDIYKKAFQVFENIGDALSTARTRGRIADILQARGQLDEALAIRQNEELPVFEKLGDVLAAAATRGNIADILAARGQPLEALKIWQGQVLPVLEQAGDTHEAAHARERIDQLNKALSAPPPKA